MTTRNGEMFSLEGRQARNGQIVLWLLDESAAARALQADEQAMRLRELIDASPSPMWRRDSDRRLIECNRAYAFAVDATPQTALAQNLELAATGLVYQWARYFPDGRRLLALANEPGKPLRLYVQSLDGKPFPMTPPAVVRNIAISPDGTKVAVMSADSRWSSTRFRSCQGRCRQL